MDRKSNFLTRSGCCPTLRRLAQAPMVARCSKLEREFGDEWPCREQALGPTCARRSAGRRGTPTPPPREVQAYLLYCWSLTFSIQSTTLPSTFSIIAV